jgi:Ger(x)C family germination protein
MSKFNPLLFLVSSTFLLTGCWDRTEINDMAFVVATGVDKGKKHDFKISIQVPLPSSMGGVGSSGGGGGTSGEEPFYVALGTGGNIRMGLEDIQLRLSRKLYFGHRRVTIIGEEMAKAGITEILNSVFIQPQSRLSTLLLVSKGEAVKLLKTQPRMEKYPGEAMREMTKAGLNMTVMDALEDLDRPGKDMIVPVVEPTGTMKKDPKGKEINMQNFALFNGDKLSFMTNLKESLGVFWLEEKMQRKTMPFSVSKDKEISVRIIDSNVKTEVKVVNDKPVFTLGIKASGILLENEPNLRLEDPETYHYTLSKMEKGIKEQVQALLTHAHSEGVDVFGFGWYLYRNHQQLWQKNWSKNWEQILKEMKVNVTVDADIQRTTNSGLIEKE